MYSKTDIEIDSIAGDCRSKGIPVVRQSSLKLYRTCPKMFKLSLDNEIETSRTMAKGLLFEGYLLGFKGDEHAIKGVGVKTKDKLKRLAGEVMFHKPYDNKTIGDIILESDAYVRQIYKTDDWALTGEADFIHPEIGIFDIKYTDNLQWSGWMKENVERWDRLQAIAYPYLWKKGTGKVPTFYYIIVEGKYEEPIIKTIDYTPNEKDFEWLENTIDIIVGDGEYRVNPGSYNDNCLQQAYGSARGRCKYLDVCEQKQKIFSGAHSLRFEY